MNKNEIAIIRQALSDIDNYDIERMKAFSPVPIPNENEFDQKMFAVAQNAPTQKSVSPRKLIVAIIAAALLLAATISAYAFRDTIKGFFIKKADNEGTTFSYESDNPIVVTEGIFMPSWLPEGYTEASHSESDLKSQTIWLKNTDRIFFTQNTLSGDMSFDTEDSNYEEIIISNQKYHYISKNGVQSIVWMTEKYSFTLWCTNITKEDALKIATSLKLEKDFPKE